MSGVVPEGWESLPLGKFLKFRRGTSYVASELSEDAYNHPLYITMKSFKVGGGYSVRGDKYYSPSYERKQAVEQDEILLANTDVTSSCDILGAPLLLPCEKLRTEVLFSHHVTAAKILENVDKDFLFYLLSSPSVRQVVQSCGRGTTVKMLDMKDMGKLSFSLPPLPEQKKIASILTSVDEVIENTQKQIDKLQDLKKATMNELLTKGIGHTEFKDSELGRIPKSWGVVSLDKVCKVRQGLQIPIRDRFKGAATGRYPYLTVSWINSKFDSDKAEFIANPNDSVVLKSNEFVVGRTGAVGQIFDGLECVFHNNFFAVSLLTDSVEKEFLKHFLKWHTTQDLLLKLAGSTTIPDLNHGDFYSINVGLPPVEEQCRVVSQVDSIDTTLREIRLKLNALMSLKKSLMQDLLTGKVRVTVN